MKSSNHTILVIGATGNQGGSVARHLLHHGNFKVRALVQDPNKPAAQTLRQAGAELFTADLNDPASLDLAMQGVYGVFSVLGFKEGLETELAQGKALADAAKKTGVSHFIYSSVGGSERKSGVADFAIKLQIEEYISSSGLPYTILGPVFFFFNYQAMRPMIEKGAFSMPLKPDTKLQQLSEEDYGKIVTSVFERPEEFMKQKFSVASVEMSMAEIAETFSSVMGKKVVYQQIPYEAFEKNAGKDTGDMFRWFEKIGQEADLPKLESEFFPLTAFESYLQEHGWGKPAANTSAKESKNLQKV